MFSTVFGAPISLERLPWGGPNRRSMAHIGSIMMKVGRVEAMITLEWVVKRLNQHG